MVEENKKEEKKRVEKVVKKENVEVDIKQDAKAFKSFVTAINSLLDEGNLQFSKDELKVQAMDPSGIAMVTITWPKKSWSKWDIKKAGQIGLNFDTLNDAMEGVQKGESLELRSADKGNKLKLTFTGKGDAREVILNNLDVRPKGDKEPKIEYDASFTIKGKTLKDIVKRTDKISSYLTIKAEDSKVLFSGKGDKGTLNEETKVPKSIGKKATAVFNVDFLKNFVRAAGKDTVITLHMKTDSPMMLEYEVSGATVKYHLAPFVEEEPEKPKKKTKAEIKKDERAEKLNREAAAKAEKERLKAEKEKKEAAPEPKKEEAMKPKPKTAEEMEEAHREEQQTKPPEETGEKKRMRA